MTSIDHKKCTWVGCLNDVVLGGELRAADGEKWANLCPAHLRELENATRPPFNAAKALAAWVKAQGGPRVAAERMSLRQPKI